MRFLKPAGLCAWLLCAKLSLAASAATPLDLPDLNALVDYRPKIPLRVYSSDGVLIGEFGQERREFIAIKDIPLVQKQALLAIEDARFYEHGGVDFKGVARALIADLSGGLKQGASTITMQVARDFYLSKEKVFSRKLTEVMLAYKIENTLSKDQILELYMNQVYLGQRAYGFGSAAQIYFGKPLRDLSLAQAAMLAGLPQAPSTVNPVANPRRARARQHLVLQRMRELGYISDAQLRQAEKEDLHVRPDGQTVNPHAQYVAEMVRQSIVAQFKDEAYTRGINVVTTIDMPEQEAAYAAVRRNAMAYDRRHGYRGPEGAMALPANASERQAAIERALQQHPASDNLLPAVVLGVTPRKVRAVLEGGEEIDIAADGLGWAKAALAPRASAALRLKPGAIIRVEKQHNGNWSITQLPDVGAALVALNSQTGAYRALVGGFDFSENQFNHVTQAWRQPGSTIKPFLYSAALEKGYAPSTLVNDTPLSLGSEETGGPPWSPQNDDGVYEDAITLRAALAHSKNVAAVRLLRAISTPYAHDFLPRFGFDGAKQPLNYTLALGTGAVTPAQLASAYAVFASGGYKLAPYLVQKVTDIRGTVLFEAKPVAVARESDRVLDRRNAFVTTSLLHSVATQGTGAAAQALGRPDLAGKTGTSSQSFDGWFAGYGGNTTTVAWMGFDTPRSLGQHEFGATVALPIWADYMKTALKDDPVSPLQPPPGLTQVDGDWVYDEFQGAQAQRGIDIEPSPTDALKDFLGALKLQ